MRIIQMVPTLNYGDAVGNDILAIRDLINTWGYETEIWALNIDPRLEKEADTFPANPSLYDEDVLIYHGAISSPLNAQFPSMKGRKVLIYHNITPPHFFHGFDNGAESSCKLGLEEMQAMAASHQIDYCLAVSEFNKKDLLRLGFTCPIDVCPILIPFEDYDAAPDSEWIRMLDDEKVNLLFVGRGSPNKKQEDVVSAFYAYHMCFNPQSRLILAGSWMESYRASIEAYIKRIGLKIGLDGDVVITGHVSFSAILSCYHVADVFLCMSEHEGFCVPLAEAMYFQIPIVAYASSAIPETLNQSGVLLNKKSSLETAYSVHRLIENIEYTQRIIQSQNRRLADFSRESVVETLNQTLLKFIQSGINSDIRRPEYNSQWKRRKQRKTNLNKMQGRLFSPFI